MSEADARRLQVLVVEDSPMNVAYVAELLGDIDCVIDSVENGLQAIETFRPGQHRLVLMDCQMPLMDGYEATRRIRAAEAAAGAVAAHIVAMTANASPGVGDRCLACGMNRVLIKPFRPEAFWAALASGPAAIGDVA